LGVVSKQKYFTGYIQDFSYFVSRVLLIISKLFN